MIFNSGIHKTSLIGGKNFDKICRSLFDELEKYLYERDNMIQKILSNKAFKIGTRIKDEKGTYFEVLKCQPMRLVDSSRSDFGLTLVNLDKEFFEIVDKGLQVELDGI